MAQHSFDTFLPSGAVDNGHQYPAVFGSRSTSISPLAVPPRAYPNPVYIPPHLQGARHSSPKPYSNAPPLSRVSSHGSHPQSDLPLSQRHFLQHNNGHPLSPPTSRSPSAEDNFELQLQSWRLYAQHLREIAQGERAHMEADRARMEQVYAEERALWEEERLYFRGKIIDLEQQLARTIGPRNYQQAVLDPTLSFAGVHTPQNGRQTTYPTKSTISARSSSNGNANNTVPQESGRNPDGSPFYAPAPLNPSRTFEGSENDDLRVDNMPAPRETPICITSKELTRSDFGIRSPSSGSVSREGSVGESIDISQIQPELEGVPIRTSAVVPEFVAKVLSPNASLSPSRPSPPQASSPLHRREMVGNQGALQRSASKSKKVSTLEVITAPEDRRLIMNAGHTPNHSVHKFDLGDSGNATPTQAKHRAPNPSVVVDQLEKHTEDIIDPDPELRGPLALRNDPPTDDIFLATLTNRLREVKESGLLSPSEISVDNEDLKTRAKALSPKDSVEKKVPTANTENIQDETVEPIEEAPILRVKASMNFGRPFGSL